LVYGSAFNSFLDHLENCPVYSYLVRERRETDAPIGDLLIYFVGHGICDVGRHLHLLVRRSREGMEEQSSIEFPALFQVLRVAAPQQRRLIILDCCFSEAAVDAFGAMGGALDDAIAKTAMCDLEAQAPSPERGTLLFCSCPRRSTSVGLPTAARTLFSGALLSVLTEGSSRSSELLSFADLREDTYDRMLREQGNGIPPRPVLHQPEQQEGDLTRLPAFPNAAAELRRKLEEEDRRRAEEEARREAEEEKRRQEAEAAQLRADEEKRRQEAEAAQLRADEEKRRQEAEAAQLRADEERRRQEA
jgi:hypothetical protein